MPQEYRQPDSNSFEPNPSPLWPEQNSTFAGEPAFAGVHSAEAWARIEKLSSPPARGPAARSGVRPPARLLYYRVLRDGARRGGETDTMDFLRKNLPTSAGRYVERYLKGINFPIRKEELVGRLEANGVPGAVVSQVRKRLPEGEYRGPKDVLDALRRR